MSRVEILGQFNVDMPCVGNSQHVKIDRQPTTTIATSGINEWTSFCDAVDETLAPLTRVRTWTKIATTLFYVFMLLFVVVFNVLPRLDSTSGTDPYVIATGAVYFFVAIYISLYCITRKKLRMIMDNVQVVCEQHSGIRTKFTLVSEHWGGCSKPHVKRYYIMVETLDEAAGAVSVAVDGNSIVEEQQNTVAGYFSTNDEHHTSTHLEDLLKS
jgi:hypothetical protein